MIRSAIPFTSSKRRSGVLRIVEAMRAPFMDSTLLASSASAHTTVNPPTRSPTTNSRMTMVVYRRTLCPCSMKYLTAQASRSISPLAKPW
uniref:Uncharacterized protein n=1 Tax=Sinocyclocheilus rhinocerous TaxID=307959 RepID=A0A673IIP2_9TELE